MFEAIPYELKELKNWCCFRSVWDNHRQKYTKIPYNPLNGLKAQSDDPRTWVSFDDAYEAIETFDGLGFFFEEPYFGVDLDNIESDILRYQAGDVEENIVAEFIELLGSYAEISPSGQGIHIIAKGHLPKGGRRKGSVEMYDSGRFFTMTGNHIGGYKHIVDDSDYGKINYLHHKYIGEEDIVVSEISKLQKIGNDLNIDEIIERAYKSKNGIRFKLFMEGGWESFYDSTSEADLGFANDLAYWTAQDYDKMQLIYRKSDLMRDKWDDSRGKNSTYGRETLNKAIRECTNVYQPKPDFQLFVDQEGDADTKRKFYSYDDMGNTERFVDAFGDNILYSYVNKMWYYYSGKVWVDDKIGKIQEMADFISTRIKDEPIFVEDAEDEKLLEQAEKAKNKHLKYTRSYRGKDNMLKDTQHHVSVLPDEFENGKYLFNTQNGYIDLNNGLLMDHNRDKKFMRISNTEYSENTDAPMWEKFLDEIFQGNQELIGYIQRAVGYCLSADVSEQMMFILIGNGRNGKSVFLNVLEEILGSYAMNIQPSTIAVSRSVSSGANPDIARLNGARLVTTTEPNKGMQLDEGIIKQMTGDDKITARFLYGSDFEFKPTFKIWMATNHKPIIQGTDDGIWRRMAIVPFEYQVPKDKVDKKLIYKLEKELTGILNWAVEGFQQWKEIGLQEPKVVADQRAEYRTDMDVVQRFIEEECVIEPSAEIKSSELWTEYKHWAKTNEEYLGSNKWLTGELKKKVDRKRKEDGFYFIGIRMRNKSFDKNSNVIRMDYSNRM